VIARLVASGNASSSYIQMLTLLLRLRQACSHPFLVLGADLTKQVISVTGCL
jgi:SNF2 family DNA or RNA helicase